MWWGNVPLYVVEKELLTLFCWYTQLYTETVVLLCAIVEFILFCVGYFKEYCVCCLNAAVALAK